MNKLLIGLLALTIIALAGGVNAAELRGTDAGTTIQNISIVSADNASAQQATRSTNVRRIGGAWYDGATGIPTDGNGTAGTPTYFTFIIANRGNSNDTFTLRIVATNTNTAVPSSYLGWTNQIVENGTDTVINTTGSLPAGNTFTFRLRVRPASTALVNSWAEYRILAISVNNATATNYTGDPAGGLTDHYAGDIGEDWAGAMGATYYGRLTHGTGSTSGGATANDYIRLTLQGPVLAITKRIVSVSGPMGSLPVPGSTITYAIYVTNSGTAAANNPRIVDTFPANTTYRDATDGVEFSSHTTNGTAAGNSIRWTAAALNNGNGDQVTFKVRIN